MPIVLRALAFIMIITSASFSFAKGGKAICDASPMSYLCNTANFSPHPDPATNAVYEAVVQPTLDHYAKTHGEIVMGTACNWRGMTVDRMVLNCRFKTYYGKKTCDLEVRANQTRSHSAITCG